MGGADGLEYQPNHVMSLLPVALNSKVNMRKTTTRTPRFRIV